VHWLDGPETYEEVLLETAIQIFPIYSTLTGFSTAGSTWE